MAYDIRKMQDIKYSEKELYLQYLTLWNNKDIDGLTNFFTTNPDFKYKTINAYNWNRLINHINDATNTQSATQDSLVGMWNSDYNELLEASTNFKYKGLWATDIAYVKNNMVKLDDYNSYYCIADHTSSNENKPPNETYWIESKVIHGLMGIPVSKNVPTGIVNNDIWFQVKQSDSYSTFSSASWDEINKVSKLGIASNVYNIGDEKDITLSNGEIITVQIVGFNHDVLAGGGVVGITVAMKNLLSTKYIINTNITPSDNIKGYEDCEFRTTTLSQLESLFPSEVKKVIKPVNKGCFSFSISGSYKQITVVDKLWLYSPLEMCIFDVPKNAYDRVYKYWEDHSDDVDRQKKLNNGSGDISAYWSRYIYPSNGQMLGTIISGNKPPESAMVNTEQGICLGFCI